MILDYINKGEGKTIEFKEKIPKGNAIVKTAIAFSNTSGGKIIIGVNDNKQIIGVSENEVIRLKEKITSMIFDSCEPKILPEVYSINYEDKTIIVIEVSRGNMLPYHIKSIGKENGTYIRIGPTNRKASSQVIIELERQKLNISYDEEIDYYFNFNDLKLGPLEKEFKEINKNLTLEKLENLKLIKREHKKIFPTKGLLIILGKYENCRINCARFKGKDMTVFIDKKEYEGDIFSQINNAEAFIKNHINIAGVIKGFRRDDILEIPYIAIREALMNAVVHRDYTNLGRDIKVGVYDDIVDIVSPGGFPYSLTEDDLFSGRSEIRNYAIARVFKELNYIERWGSGVKRIIKSCLNQGLKKPLIMEKNDSVEVILFRNTGDYLKEKEYSEKTITSEKVPDKETNVPENTEKTPDYQEFLLSEQKKTIKEYLKYNEEINRKKVEELLMIKERRARYILKEMVEDKILKKVGSGRNVFYTII